MPDIKLLMIEVDGGNDPVFVTTNVEHIVIASFVRGVKRGFDLGKVREHSGFNDLTPRLHRLICCRMDRRKSVSALLEAARKVAVISHFEMCVIYFSVVTGSSFSLRNGQ